MHYGHVQHGFTLLELMITLVIAAVLLGVAVPSLQGLLGGNAMSATVNTVVHSLHTARSEAVKRALPVGLCASTTSLADNAACAANTSLAAGWIVYVDDNGDGARAASEELVLQVEPRNPAFTLTTDDTLGSQIYFNDSGYSTSVAGIPLSGSIAISHQGADEDRRIDISANGRIATVTP